MKELRKPEKRMRDYNKIKLQDSYVTVEYGMHSCGSSLHHDNYGCGTEYDGSDACYPSGSCTRY